MQNFFLLLFFATILGSIDFILDPLINKSYNSKNACPSGYFLADLSTNELWRRGVRFAFKILGYNKRVWIKKALNWTGTGRHQWMIATPTNPKTCIFPPKGLDSFCIPNFSGKLVIKSHNINITRLPSLCMKKSHKRQR